jgi:cyclic pyranopterin phosphate synthase
VSVADTLHRPLRDLRISVTDRCNFRCVYCMPKEIFGREYHFLDRQSLLTFEEIGRLGRLFVDLGVRKIRLTGGEPLVRRDLDSLVAMLAPLPGVEIVLTTNGSLLPEHAESLKAAGLRRVTLSLDSLDDAVFRAMNDAEFPVASVLEGIEAAEREGLAPVKINMVVKRGVNEASILPMAERFRHTGHILRFIEYMDVGQTNGWRMDDVVPGGAILARLQQVYPLEPLEANYDGEVARRWRYRDGAGEIGVVASVTQAFCRDCTRARLSADGSLFTCLFAAQGHDLRSLLRGGAPDDDVRQAIRAIWTGRGDRYSEIRSEATSGLNRVEMSFIGG